MLAGRLEEGKRASGGQRPGGLWKPILAGGWISGLRLNPVISLRALAKPRIHWDRTNWSKFMMSVACGASKEVDINRWVSIQPLI